MHERRSGTAGSLVGHLNTAEVRKVLAAIENEAQNAAPDRRASLDKRANALRAGLAADRKEELSEDCLEALATLVQAASAIWLEAQDEPWNEAYQTLCANNIEHQVLLGLFRPPIGPPSDPFHPDPRRGIQSLA